MLKSIASFFHSFQVPFSMLCLLEMEKTKHRSHCRASITVAWLTLETKEGKRPRTPITPWSQHLCCLIDFTSREGKNTGVGCHFLHHCSLGEEQTISLNILFPQNYYPHSSSEEDPRRSIHSSLFVPSSDTSKNSLKH